LALLTHKSIEFGINTSTPRWKQRPILTAAIPHVYHGEPNITLTIIYT
jgi:hypothetical protein